jgi:hypothetical protein
LAHARRPAFLLYAAVMALLKTKVNIILKWISRKRCFLALYSTARAPPRRA